MCPTAADSRGFFALTDCPSKLEDCGPAASEVEFTGNCFLYAAAVAVRG